MVDPRKLNRKLPPYLAFSFQLIVLSMYTSSFEPPWNISIHFCTSKSIITYYLWVVVWYHSQNLSCNIHASPWYLASSARRHLAYWIFEDTSSDSGSVFPSQNVFNVLWSLNFFVTTSIQLMVHPDVYLPIQNQVLLHK